MKSLKCARWELKTSEAQQEAEVRWVVYFLLRAARQNLSLLTVSYHAWLSIYLHLRVAQELMFANAGVLRSGARGAQCLRTTRSTRLYRAASALSHTTNACACTSSSTSSSGFEFLIQNGGKPSVTQLCNTRTRYLRTAYRARLPRKSG
jgi:hypothetical protein